MPMLQFFVSDHVADTHHLSLEDQGCYVMIMFLTWLNKCRPFPDDDTTIPRMLHITKKKWGYYLTDSCNYTLIKNGFKTAIVVSQLSKKNKIFIKLVHMNKLSLFNRYLIKNKSYVLTWLDEWNKN